MSLRHRLRVTQVVREAPGVVSLYVTGRELDRLPARGGQYFPLAFPDPRWLVADAPLLAVGTAQQPVPAPDRQGHRRR